MGTARGAYAEYAMFDARLANAAPPILSWEEAAAALGQHLVQGLSP
jgi:NADPH:quinone reductase-like Zn-dependent oxidoreductase